MAEQLNSETCAALLEQQRYDPEILPRLEAYVDAQCKNVTYDLDCNLAILKLYKFHPDKADEGYVAKILLKALMNLPHTDYLLCTYLVPESMMEREDIAKLSEIAVLLETCCFRGVWESLKEIPVLLEAIPGFDDAIRDFMLSTLQITYQAVPEEHLQQSLGMEAAGLAQVISSRGWTVEEGIVKIGLNDDNTAKPKKADVGGAMGFDQMTKILSSIAS